MIAGKQYEGPLADIWSMGVILFALVCGFLPFEDQNTSVLYRKILAGDYKPPKWISNEVRDLIRLILETDPRKRFRIADIRQHTWYNIITEEEVPKEAFTVLENDKIKAETMQLMTEAGMDIQALKDGLSSRSCNGLTAHYYLLLQKHRNKLLLADPVPAVGEETIPRNQSMKPETATTPPSALTDLTTVALVPPPLLGDQTAPVGPAPPLRVRGDSVRNAVATVPSKPTVDYQTPTSPKPPSGAVPPVSGANGSLGGEVVAKTVPGERVVSGSPIRGSAVRALSPRTVASPAVPLLNLEPIQRAAAATNNKAPLPMISAGITSGTARPSENSFGGRAQAEGLAVGGVGGVVGVGAAPPNGRQTGSSLVNAIPTFTSKFTKPFLAPRRPSNVAGEVGPLDSTRTPASLEGGGGKGRPDFSATLPEPMVPRGAKENEISSAPTPAGVSAPIPQVPVEAPRSNSFASGGRYGRNILRSKPPGDDAPSSHRSVSTEEGNRGESREMGSRPSVPKPSEISAGSHPVAIDASSMGNFSSSEVEAIRPAQAVC